MENHIALHLLSKTPTIMAEVSSSSGPGESGGKVRAKKLSTKIDMTPMVDLAFLLLTFFLLTTTFNKPSVMSLTMPEREKDQSKLPELTAENAFNVVLGEGDRIYWWIGFAESAEATNYSKDGLRKILLEKSRANPDLMVLIKPMDKSRYENVVDVLDEVAITDISRYAIVAFQETDKGMIPQ